MWLKARSEVEERRDEIRVLGAVHEKSREDSGRYSE